MVPRGPESRSSCYDYLDSLFYLFALGSLFGSPLLRGKVLARFL